MYTGFWLGNLGERDHLGDQGVDGLIIEDRSSGSGMLGVWSGSSWLRIWIGGGHL